MSSEVLLSGFIGGVVVFFLGLLRDYRKQRRELAGHLSLISSEMWHNSSVLEAYRENLELLRQEQGASLRKGAWEATQLRVSETAHLEVLIHTSHYYALLENVYRLARGWQPEDKSQMSAAVVFDNLEFAARDAGKAIEKHMPMLSLTPKELLWSLIDRGSSRSGA